MKIVNLNKKIDALNYQTRMKSSKKNKILRRILSFFVVLLLISILPAFMIVAGVRETISNSKVLVEGYKNQNFTQIQDGIKLTKRSLQKVDLPLNFFIWMRAIPILGGYYHDIKGFSKAGVEELAALEKIFVELEPDKDELGFNGQPQAGQDRVSQGIKILDKTLPHLDKVEGNLKRASKEVENINTDKYPESYRGYPIRRLLQTGKNFIIGAHIAATSARSALEIAPAALGQPNAKNYLLLFQNDKEIRPTGGFLTAFAFMEIDKGQISHSTSDDIYRLDERLLEVCRNKICPLAPPDPLVKYLPETTGKVRTAWSMRDSNLSPDLPTSAKEFERMYQMLGQGLPYDGIIYIDTQVVEELIEVTGPIEVLGTTYSAEIDKRCNCPNVIYELESYAEIAAKGQEDRKAILGVLMQQILARSIGADVEKMPMLIETVARLANHKHIMFYMHDEKVQRALADLNWIGEIKDYEGDYLHINDSNFAGGKSNLYVTQTVKQDISVEKDGIVKKKIVIEYKNPQPFNIWLNGINRSYVRFFVPSGSKLVSSKGSEDPVKTSEELGKTVFEAFVIVRPQNSRKLEIEYTVPYNPKGEYSLLIQKQPGAKDFEYKIKLNGRQGADFELDMDKEFRFNL